ncbi:unnamed protein product [Calypogeia fissa]
MDPDVWKNMPDELIPLILARLPWWGNLQLRGVCKSWNAKLSNAEFFSSFNTVQTSAPHSLYGILSPGILSTAGSCAAVNLVGKHYWNVLPRPSSLPNFQASDFFELQASSAGLLLMEGKLIEKGRILVNPVNKTHRRVPPVPTLTGEGGFENYVARGLLKEHTEGMVVDTHTKSVRIIVLQHQPIDGHVVPTARNQTFMSDLELWRIHVYDMGRNAWDLVARFQSEHLQRIKNAILVGETLYILTKQPSFRHRHRHRVFRASGTELLEVPAEITIDIPTVHIFQHRGSLMLVGGTVLKQSGVDIWRWDDGGEHWHKVMSMPGDLVDSGWGRRDFQINAEGDFLCLASYAKKDVVLLVNLVKEEWKSVSYKNDYIYQDWASIRTFLWQPRLDIVL